MAASAATSGSAASAASQSVPSQRDWPVPGHRPDRDTQPLQLRGKSTNGLARPEHRVQPGLIHGAVLSLALK